MPKKDKPSSRAVAAGEVVDELATTREGPPLAPKTLILDAGERVIAKKGFARSTVEDISRKAGVPTSVFYAHFAGKGALLRALTDRFCEQAMLTADQATRSGIWRNAAARDVIEVAVRSILEVVLERQGLLRAVLSHGTTDTALPAVLRKIGQHMTKRLQKVFDDPAESVHDPPDDKTLAFCLLLAVSLAHHTILVGETWSGTAFGKEDLATEAARAVAAYLSASRAPS